ncbi:unnamed protein product [Tuber melanosporum]|uniref:(Perigord truffle) hypothetical protein n=1 Tax=Tuber melanosporum (strain Mel28) TaxID=656061 RepID=D5GHC1_TUBMM|nr:uncharacterized protein GSTUM_00007743001 [Tuber melanosporum]CAZ83873.1 unnamed protein product [Tuber melanosporum]
MMNATLRIAARGIRLHVRGSGARTGEARGQQPAVIASARVGVCSLLNVCDKTTPFISITSPRFLRQFSTRSSTMVDNFRIERDAFGEIKHRLNVPSQTSRSTNHSTACLRQSLKLSASSSVQRQR